MSSNPEIVRVTDLPAAVPPGDTFTVDVKIKQRTGADPIGTGAGCTTPKLNVLGWETPVRARVDGEQVDEETLCMGKGTTKTASLTIPADGRDGENVRVEIEAIKKKDSLLDLEGASFEVNDDYTSTVQLDESLDDTSQDPPKSFLTGIAEALGATVQQVMMWGAVALALLLVLS